MSNHFEADSRPSRKKNYGVRDSNPPLLLFPVEGSRYTP